MTATLLNFTGFETGSSSTTVEFYSCSSTATVQSTVKRTGTYALRVNNTAGSTSYIALKGLNADGTINASFNQATTYHRFYFYAHVVPSAGQAAGMIYSVWEADVTPKISIRINSDRKLEIWSRSPALVATGATVLELDTWYCIELYSTTGSGTSAYELKINNSSELSGSCYQSTSNANTASCGSSYSGHAESLDFYYDDWAVAADTWIGPGASVRMTITGDGSTHAWHNGTGTTYAEVDEVTASTTDYLTSSTGGNQVHLVALDSCANMGITGTPNALKCGIYVAEDAKNKTSSTRARIYSGGSTTDTTGHDGAGQYVYRYLWKIATTDPATSAAWTTSGIDGAEVGVIEVNAVAQRCAWIAGYVDYAPSTDYDATVSPVTGTFTPVVPTPTMRIKATVSPISRTFSLPAVTATYVYHADASVSPISRTFSIPAVTATYQVHVDASVSPVTRTFSLPAVTATYQAVLDASVSPVTRTFALPAVTATYDAVLQASVSPVTRTFALPAVTATYAAVIDASVSPVTAAFALPAVTADYSEGQEEVAVVSPVTATFALPTVTATYHISAVVSPISVTLSTTTTTATYEAELSAAVSPVTGTFSTPAVTATYDAVLTAGVSPVAANFALPAVTASYYSGDIAVVAPVSVVLSLPTVAAAYEAICSATLSPVTLIFSCPACTPTSTFKTSNLGYALAEYWERHKRRKKRKKPEETRREIREEVLQEPEVRELLERAVQEREQLFRQGQFDNLGRLVEEYRRALLLLGQLDRAKEELIAQHRRQAHERLLQQIQQHHEERRRREEAEEEELLLLLLTEV